jgi:Domain of unknown function (DUF4411)
MLYLLDANVLIDAGRDYYPRDRVPEFWEWLQFQGESGVVKIPEEMYEEVVVGRDPVAAWLRQESVKRALLLSEEVDPDLVVRAVEEGYASNMTQVEVETIGRDPFLIAYALAVPHDRCVVTTEGRKPSRKRHNRKMPDVCDGLGLNVCHTFEMLRVLNFTTQWRQSAAD